MSDTMYVDIKIFFRNVLVFYIILSTVEAVQPAALCRDRSNQLREDGGLCFEIPPWQHQPVELENHLQSIKKRWGNETTAYNLNRRWQLAMVDSGISRYIDTVLSPFLETYHKNIQSAYQQQTTKILKRIKEEIYAAVKKKHKVYNDLTQLADKLQVSDLCEEERREAKTLSSRHVAEIYKCTEDARASIYKMGYYAEQMILITRSHMQVTMDGASENFEDTRILRNSKRYNLSVCLKDISREAVAIGYELDLSLTNARRHNEQSCEKVTNCINLAKAHTDDDVDDLRDKLYQCVYA